jgi:hypothetical protein
MRRELFRLAAGIVLALLLAGSGAAAEVNYTSVTNQTPPAVWERTYGGLANETLLSLLGSPDGGYQLVGSSANETGEELYLVRTNPNGTPVREERVPFGPGSPVKVARTPDGGIVVVGGTGGAGSEEIVLLRLAPDERRLWSRSYSVGSGRDEGGAVRPAADGGYLVAGTTASPNSGTPELLLLKVGEDGNEVWHRAITLGAGILVVRDLRATPDGGYLVIGSTDAGRAGFLDMLLVKVSSGGNREWERTYSFGAERASGHALEPSLDGGWLLLGNVEGGGTPAHAAVLVKVDTAGNEQWRKRVAAAGATWGYALARAGADGYAVAGAVEAPEGTRSYVARLDRNGAEAWNRSFAIGNGPSRALAVTAVAPDRLVVGGEASRTPDALYDLYLTSAVPPTVAPNATATTTVNMTATATPDVTPTTNATPIPTTAVPATTQAALAPLPCLIAVAGVALAALRRR